MLALAERGLADPAALLGTLGLDPLGLRARTGVGPDVASVVPLAQRVAAEHPLVRAIVVDALPLHDAGGADAQELGFSMAAGVAYLRALTDAGLDVATAARLLEFRYAATDDQFPTIAKLRAARRLWARVAEACGAGRRSGQRQHAVSSPTMFDPPRPLGEHAARHDRRLRRRGRRRGRGHRAAVRRTRSARPTPFARRIARNTQALLIEESHLARVIDPAGGSWYVESLTDDLARAGWAFFQEIEAAGGAVAALDSGLVAERVAAVRAAAGEGGGHPARRRSPASASSPTSPRSRWSATPRPAGPGRRPAASTAPRAPFEACRDRSDAVLAATGARRARSWPRSARSPRYTARARSPATCWPRAASTPSRPARPRPPTAVAAAFAASRRAGRGALLQRRALRRTGAATAAALRAAGARRSCSRAGRSVPGIDG